MNLKVSTVLGGEQVLKRGYPEAIVKVFSNIDKGKGARRADVVLVLREAVKSFAMNCPNTSDQDCTWSHQLFAIGFFCSSSRKKP